MRDQLLVNFCTKVRTGFGSIKDSSVKEEFERIYETEMAHIELAGLLALLEKYELIDKRNSVNKDNGFYQFMYVKMKKSV